MRGGYTIQSVVFCRLGWQQSGSDVVVQWANQYELVSGITTVGTVDTLCLVFVLDAMKVGVQLCVMCSEANYGSLTCSA